MTPSLEEGSANLAPLFKAAARRLMQGILERAGELNDQ